MLNNQNNNEFSHSRIFLRSFQGFVLIKSESEVFKSLLVSLMWWSSA